MNNSGELSLDDISFWDSSTLLLTIFKTYLVFYLFILLSWALFGWEEALALIDLFFGLFLFFELFVSQLWSVIYTQSPWSSTYPPALFYRINFPWDCAFSKLLLNSLEAHWLFSFYYFWYSDTFCPSHWSFVSFAAVLGLCGTLPSGLSNSLILTSSSKSL